MCKNLIKLDQKNVVVYAYLKILPFICFEGLKEAAKDLGQGSRYLGRVLKSVSSEFEAGVYSVW
jgi:hypothetical protein